MLFGKDWKRNYNENVFVVVDGSFVTRAPMSEVYSEDMENVHVTHAETDAAEVMALFSFVKARRNARIRFC